MNITQQLVSFGNYLLKEIKAHDSEGRQREVTHADLENFKETHKQDTANVLPSGFQIGEKCSIKLRPMFVVDTGTVTKVHFAEGKVLYDLEVQLDLIGTPIPTTRIYNVDSALLSKFENA